DLGMMALGAMQRGLLVGQFFRGIEIQHPLARIADHGLLAGAHFVVSLRPQHYLAAHALVIADLGDAAAPELGSALVVSEQILGDAGAQLVAFAAPFRQKLLVFGGALTGLLFLFLDLCRLFFQLGLRDLDFLVASVRVDHQLQNLVLVRGDFFLSELDLVQQRFVLLVGFYIQRLVAVLGNFAAQLSDVGLVFAAGSFVGLDGGLRLVQLGLGSGEFLL